MSSECKTQAAAARPVVDGQLVVELVARVQADGVAVGGEGGLLQQLTKIVLELSLEGEIDAHLGYGKHDPAGRDGGNSRNGKRAKTVLTEAGPMEVEVPRDRDGSFEPQLVKKRQRRLGGVDGIVVSLSAKGLTTGEISAHLAEVYGASVPRDTISAITDRVLDGLAEWQNRPLDPAQGPTGCGEHRVGQDVRADLCGALCRVRVMPMRSWVSLQRSGLVLMRSAQSERFEPGEQAVG